MALALCRLMRVEPSILLHPLDFLGGDDERDLAFFPAMGMPAERKLALVERALDQLAGAFRIVPMHEHAAAVRERMRRTSPAAPGGAAATSGA